MVKKFKHVSDVFRVLDTLYHYDDDDDDDDDDNDDDDDDDDEGVDSDYCLYDKVEFHVELAAHEKVKHCVHHLLVLHLVAKRHFSKSTSCIWFSFP